MSEQAEKYQRKHDFAPYTKADGNAVAEEFDGVQAHLEKIPALRNDGKGFAENFVITEPTEDNHPVTYGQLKNAENSVQKNKDTVVQKAQEVAQNTLQVSQNTLATEKAKEQAQNSAQLATLSAQTATEQASNALNSANIASQKSNEIVGFAKSASSSKDLAHESEQLARKWSTNPEDEQVKDGAFSAYHYAQKARKSAERAESLSGGKKEWSDILNVPKATLGQDGVVSLSNDIDSDSESTAATSKALKEVHGTATTRATDTTSGQTMLSHKIDGIDKSKAASEFALGELNKELAGKGVPLGSIIAFPKEITHPPGYLKCDGSTFSSQTYPDLYRTLGNKNKLPNLKRSDVGMTAYFAVDDIPDGWIYFDNIATQVTPSTYPELYQHLVRKYGSISAVPKAQDRFVRNAGNGLSVGQTQEDAIRNITGGVDANYNGKSVLYTEASGAFVAEDIGSNRYSFYTSNHMYRGKDIKFDASRVVPTADENRPRSIVLKLCIKVGNSFDDVQFWIKAYGVVENVGSLDASALAQNIQQVSAKTQQLEESFNQNKERTSLKIQAIERQLNEDNQGSVVWSGNVTQHSTNIIELSESILNKTLIFYLQVSQSHSLQQNVDTYTVSVFVDKELINTSGRKYLHAALHVGSWKNCKIELVSATQIKIIDISSMYLKKITAA
ncbi:phage tail protein [Pasteurella oralis]|uniref:phage tail protein n=1 Tax=Pasteurella oralis TaxID=1071947 RepID=UPI000C7B22CF|nr:phage tail protein [Pasteurella oralis]